MAHEASGMFTGTDTLSNNGINESNGMMSRCGDTGSCGDSALGIPILTDTNFDRIVVGSDNARAFGLNGFFPFINDPAKATNNLEIKKNQQVGACVPCTVGGNCSPACTVVNVDQVKVGDRNAQAFGNAEAVNNVKLVLNQARG